MKDKDTHDYLASLEHMDIPMIREELAPYLVHKVQGEFTIEDYYTFPDDHRVELIDGVIYDLSAPTYIHQGISLEISRLLINHIHQNNGTCKVFSAPADVQLNQDNKTMLQPDIFVICDRNKLNNKVFFGAPDLVVEILSPSTRKKDIVIKTGKYRNAGVREYWIVDPIKKQIRVYEFGKANSSAWYTFEDKVPVGIWNGECVVDFKEIYEYVKFLEE